MPLLQLTKLIGVTHCIFSTYQIVESSANSFIIDPDLPLSRFPIPRLAHVVPSEEFNWIIETMYCVSIHHEHVVTPFVMIRDPGQNRLRLMRHCGEK